MFCYVWHHGIIWLRIRIIWYHARLSYVVRQRRVPRAVPLRMQFRGAVCNGTAERAPSHARFACCVQLGTHKRGLKKRADMTESLRKVQAAAKAAGIVDTKTKKK